MAVDPMQAELERLREENEALKRRAFTRERARRTAAIALLVLGCGLAALSVVAIWLRVTLLDTERYVRTVAPIAAEPAVQDAVANRLSGAINEKIDFASLFRQGLPDRADVLAPALEAGLESFIHTRLQNFTRSERFQELWVEANRRAHTRVVELVTGGRSGRLELDEDTVYLDLSPVVDRIRMGLTDRGFTRVAAAIPPTVDGRIPLVQSDALVQTQSALRLLKAVAVLLPVLALACLAGVVALTRPRRRGLLHVSIGVALSMLLLVAALGVARSFYLDALSQGALPRSAASDIFDTLVAFLRTGVRVVVVLAALLALAAFLFGLPLGRLWERAVTDSRRAWVARYRDRLLVGVGAVAGLALLVRDPLNAGYVAVVLSLAVIAAGLIAVLALTRASPATGDADPPLQGA